MPMPLYEFEKDGAITELVAPMDRIPGLTRELEARGFRRIFARPALHVYPVTAQEALEWAEEDTRREEQEYQVKHRELMREAISQIPLADREGLLNGEIEI